MNRRLATFRVLSSASPRSWSTLPLPSMVTCLLVTSTCTAKAPSPVMSDRWSGVRASTLPSALLAMKLPSVPSEAKALVFELRNSSEPSASRMYGVRSRLKAKVLSTSLPATRVGKRS